MALPPAGNSISISQIKAELGSSSNSLRALSAAAGKSTPDAMSEFFGYSAGYYYQMERYNCNNCSGDEVYIVGYSSTPLPLNYFYATISPYSYQRQAQISPTTIDIDFSSTSGTSSCVSCAPVYYTYNIVAYSGYVTVSGTYTNTGGGTSSFSFYNYSGSGGVVGSVCALANTVSVTSGNGTKTQGGTC